MLPVICLFYLNLDSDSVVNLSFELSTSCVCDLFSLFIYLNFNQLNHPKAEIFQILQDVYKAVITFSDAATIFKLAFKIGSL